MDKETLLNKIRKNSDISFLEDMSADLKSDYDFILNAVKNHGESLKYASDSIKDNRIVVLEAIRPTDIKAVLKNENAIAHASRKLLNDKSFILEALTVNAKIYPFLDEVFKEDFEIIKHTIKSNPKVFEKLSEKYRGNFEIAKLAISAYAYNLKYASKELQNNI